MKKTYRVNHFIPDIEFIQLDPLGPVSEILNKPLQFTLWHHLALKSDSKRYVTTTVRRLIDETGIKKKQISPVLAALKRKGFIEEI